MKNKMLIVYYSISNGNTERIARQLQIATGADIEKIETEQPYTGSYQEIVEQGQREVTANYQPKIKRVIQDPENYDVIAIGTPTWWYTMAPAVKTFLKEHNWEGKKIIPFQTHGGWAGHVFEDISAICDGAEIVHEMKIQFDSTGGSHLETPEDSIQQWIEEIKREIK